MKLPPLQLISRDDFLLKRCSGKRVLHIGCTDWPMLQSKLDEGRHLHQLICNVADECIGLDIDEEGIKQLAKLMPDEKFVCHSAESLTDCPELAGKTFDIVLAADVVEHLSNIGQFLQGAREVLGESGELIVTVPHAYSIKRLLGVAVLGVEHVHPDHIAYFSLSTLKSILGRAGYGIAECLGFQWWNPTLRNRMAYLATWPFMALSRNRLSDEIAIIAKKNAMTG